ncbi:MULTISPECIES: homocysteine S-methyltransferase [unclassified Leucobacter]|uniref:homocysteine S-methyltransferase n=1 Tax=unclassified Leucobacter TaxID=2621730 RepID=UPI00165E6CA3|nr:MULTISPECIES: homocysteine S-methyltransferase [unclassified Leucobacter]MBC9935888.1 homocysteine S-methyltransferase [Leucobacter sp. cx-87]
MPAFLDALQSGVVPLDGGLGTHLEARGNSVASALWSARILLEQPDEVRAAHLDFFQSGARVATTGSYQVSASALASAGFDPGLAPELLARSVELAREARSAAGLGPGEAWVAASLGPYGASLGDGSEYTGAYGLSVAELREWHRPRLAALVAARPDVVFAETIPSLAEAAAIAAEGVELDLPVVLSVTVADGALRSGDALADLAALAAQHPGIVALGVNCSSVDETDAALRVLATHTELPLIAYPNSGEVWDARSRSWSGTGRSIVGAVDEWRALGVRAIGGCCRVGTDEVATLSRRITVEAAG